MVAERNGRSIWVGVLGALAAGLTAWIPNVAGWIDSQAARSNAQAAALLAAESKVDNDDEHETFRTEIGRCATREELMQAIEQMEAQIGLRLRTYQPISGQLQLDEEDAGELMGPPQQRQQRVMQLLQQKGVAF